MFIVSTESSGVVRQCPVRGRGRPPYDGQEIPGVLQSEGRTWLEQRRFALRTLRDFGFGKSGMEQMIKEEVTK